MFPPVNNVLGFYVEDETPRGTLRRMERTEQCFAEDYGDTNLCLIYCLVDGDLNYWQQAATATGMFRAYPFLSGNGGNLQATREVTQQALLDVIDN